MPDPTVQLRAYGGSAELERPIIALTGGPWAGRVVVRHYQFRAARGSRPDWFVVAASWTGPPMDGFPRLPEIADREDTLPLDDLELAQAVAQAAIDDLRAPRVPDLRALAKRFKRAE
ncbi:MAG TPA: hypothetical protein VMY78_09975 [Solirubrobacteraceae bacterium]|nr:hypothetical protein [Solirubrobacteraceae bacterium]